MVQFRGDEFLCFGSQAYQQVEYVVGYFALAADAISTQY